MFFLKILFGIALIAFGIWIFIGQVKWYQKGLKDFSGGHIRLLICAIGFFIGGIIVICQQI
ncbi:MAG: hypothetical protein JSU01_12675 [Bacteroidetes bacterium]|nr:hypothetical protein [Bacteroidota bacterium]